MKINIIMRKILFTLTMIAVGLVAKAEDAAVLKNAGNDALKAGDYKTALAKYDAYLASGEEGAADDKATIYNAAKCASKLDKNDKALSYYKKCVDMKYKGDYATYYIAQIYKDQDNEDLYLTTLEDGLKKYPASKVKKHYLKGITDHYNAIAAEPYNKANALATEAAVSGDAGIYLNKMKEALDLFDQAKSGFEKTLEFDPSNTIANSAISGIKSQIDAYNTYKASLQ